MGINVANLDLLSVGIAAAGMLILGFVTFFNSPKSISSRFFLCLAIVASVWGIVNYASYNVTSIPVSFWLLRFVMFFAVGASFFTFILSYVFPLESVKMSRFFVWVVAPLSALAAVLALTPLVFSGVAGIEGGHVTRLINGPGIGFFGVMILFLNIGGVVLLIKRIMKTDGPAQRPLQIFLLGFMLMLGCIIAFNFIMPAFFSYTRFIPLGGLFLFPFVALTSFAMLRYHLFSVKVVATEILAFVLAVVSLSQVVLSGTLAEIFFRIAVFVLTLTFGIFLIKSVRREVQQREELERLYKQLEEQNAKLDELSHFKSELLSLASHQIRSPLAAMKGFLALVMDGTYGAIDPRAKEALGKTQRSADELIGLINTLLDVRKVEEGKMEYQFTRTDLKKIVGDVVALLTPLAAVKSLAFTLEAPDHEVWVNADGEKLKQVIQNLIDNSIKYTPSGFVKVVLKEATGAGAAAGAVTMTVSDSGVGVPESLIPHLFEEFIRDERIKKEIRGTGLGLYIARRIAEAHGGKIWAESAGPGKGSAFSVSVPLVR